MQGSFQASRSALNSRIRRVLALAIIAALIIPISESQVEAGREIVHQVFSFIILRPEEDTSFWTTALMGWRDGFLRAKT